MKVKLNSNQEEIIAWMNINKEGLRAGQGNLKEMKAEI
jgi:hypothetical protein